MKATMLCVRRWRYGRSVCLFVVSVVMVGQPLLSAAAQTAELRPGAYVRLRAPGVLAGEFEGSILHRGHDTLLVARTGAAPVAVPFGSITSAAVYLGRTRAAGARKGTKWGAGVGLGLGLFNVAFSECSDCETGYHVVGVVTVTAAGAGLGALVGSIVRGERWERVQLPQRIAPPVVATTPAWSPPR